MATLTVPIPMSVPFSLGASFAAERPMAGKVGGAGGALLHSSSSTLSSADARQLQLRLRTLRETPAGFPSEVSCRTTHMAS